MRYYLIAGEASGDLHAANLMRQIKELDKEADFRYFGGELMQNEGGVLVKHYRDMAFMGFVAVAMNIRKILNNLKVCKEDIAQYKPDAVILIDYPGFNLKIANYVKHTLKIPVHYYIAPKIWAWKEYRIKNIKRDVDYMYSILPFETDYFANLNYKVDYIGNPTVDELTEMSSHCESFETFTQKNSLNNKPIIALISGSRVGEIRGTLPIMIEATKEFTDYQLVVAGAPSINPKLYNDIIGANNVKVVYGATFSVMKHATAALVTSGTATLEAAILDLPQVVCYHVFGGRLTHKIFQHVLKIKYVSLVNLIANRLVVKELLAHHFNAANSKQQLTLILEKKNRTKMLKDYQQIRGILGSSGAAKNCAELIYKRIMEHKYK